MSERPTPITDAAVAGLPNWFGKKDIMDADEMRNLERQLAEAREEIGRIRKFATVNGVAELERQLAEARKQRDALAELAGELIAMIRTNVMRDTFREATIEQVDAHLEPWIKQLHAVKESTQEQP